MTIDAEMLKKEIQGMENGVAQNTATLEQVKGVLARSEGALAVLKAMLAEVQKPEPTKAEEPVNG